MRHWPVWIVVLTFSLLARAQDLSILREARIEGGLALLVQPPDDRLEQELAATGRWLILSLVADETQAQAKRERLASAGDAGVVHVTPWLRPGRLPLADHSANLVVVHGGADDAEVLRVAAPLRGKALVQRDGKWTALDKPMPREFGEWGQFFHAADGNAVSRDTAVKVPNALRWIGGPLQHDSAGANEWRLAGGIAISEWNYPLAAKERRSVAIEGRDAFNGTLLWQRIIPNAPQAVKTKPVILADGKLIRIDDELTPQGTRDPRLASYDPLTGQLLKRYDNSYSIARPDKRGFKDFEAIYHDGAIYQAVDRGVRCIDAQSGALRWEYLAEEGRGNLYRPTIETQNGLLVLVEGPSPSDALARGQWKGLYGGRYPGPIVDHVLAVDLKSGQMKWRVQRDPQIEQLPGGSHDPAGGRPYYGAERRKIVFHVVACREGRIFLLFACDANGGGPSLILCHDAATGKELWRTITHPQYDPKAAKPPTGGEMFNLFLLEDGTIFTYGHGWARLEQATGKFLAFGERFGGIAGNARCDTGSSTVSLIAGGFGNYFDLTSPQLQWTRRDLARGQCGGRTTPAYGMFYYQPSGCKCFSAIRGQMALYRAPDPQPLADEARRVTGPSIDNPLTQPPPATDWPTYLHDGQRSGWSATAGPRQLKPLWKTAVAQPLSPDLAGVRQDWLQTSIYNGPVTAPVIAAGLVFTVDRDRHRLVALDELTGKPRWTYPTEGRVITTPTFHRGRLVFGTRNGYVHCVDAATGRRAWRFLAAPEQRLIMAYGQIESAWPLHGSLAVVEDIAVATAGYHGEADGGVWAWGLEITTGKPVWRKQLYRPERQWQTFAQNPDGGLGRRVKEEPHPLAEVNRANGSYHVTAVRNLDLPMADGAVVQAARVLLNGATGELAATPAELTTPANKGGAPAEKIAQLPRFIDYEEQFPFLDMEFDAPGGPHGPGAWRWEGIGGRDTVRRLAFHGDAVLIAVVRHPAPVLFYLPAKKQWNRDFLRTAKPLAELKGQTDSLVVAGQIAYAAGEVSAKNATRSLKGEPIAGHLTAVALEGGAILADVELDRAAINNGLAVANGRLYVACEDGTIRCFGE